MDKPCPICGTVATTGASYALMFRDGKIFHYDCFMKKQKEEKAAKAGILPTTTALAIVPKDEKEEPRKPLVYGGKTEVKAPSQGNLYPSSYSSPYSSSYSYGTPSYSSLTWEEQIKRALCSAGENEELEASPKVRPATYSAAEPLAQRPRKPYVPKPAYSPYSYTSSYTYTPPVATPGSSTPTPALASTPTVPSPAPAPIVDDSDRIWTGPWGEYD